MKAPVQPPRIDHLPRGTIHAVGAAGLETAAMVRFLDAMSAALNRQVFIEAKFMELNDEAIKDLGINVDA